MEKDPCLKVSMFTSPINLTVSVKDICGYDDNCYYENISWNVCIYCMYAKKLDIPKMLKEMME